MGDCGRRASTKKIKIMFLKKSVYILIIVLIVCAGMVFYFWKKAESIKIEEIPPPPSWIEDKEAAETLTIVITPFEDPKELYERWKPLRDYLNEKLREKFGLKIKLKVATEYRSAINEVGLGVADLAILPPLAYVEARRSFCVRPLVTVVSGEGNRCLLVARKEAPISSISDIKRKSFAYADEKSLCGSLIPHKWMKENNIVYNTDLGAVKYFSNYNEVLQALISGRYDVGGVKESTFKRANPPNLKIVARSDPLPDLLIVATFDLEKDIVEEIIKNLTEMDAKIIKQIDPDYTGWKRAEDKDYDVIREMAKNIHGLDYYLPTPDFCAIKPKCKLAPKK